MNMNKQKIICIRCPKGCEVLTTLDGYTIESISGNTCKLGEDYVENEVKDPRRIITTTVKVKNGIHPLIPVWTPYPIKKDRIFDLMKKINEIELDAPIDINQIVIKNALNLGINVVTSGKVNRK